MLTLANLNVIVFKNDYNGIYNIVISRQLFEKPIFIL